MSSKVVRVRGGSLQTPVGTYVRRGEGHPVTLIGMVHYAISGVRRPAGRAPG